MEHGFALDTGEAHLMFLATRETVRDAFGLRVGADARLGLPWLGIPHSAPEQSEDARFGLPLLGGPHSAPARNVL